MTAARSPEEAIRELSQLIGSRLIAAYSTNDPWAVRVRAALGETLAVLDEHRDLARTCLIQAASRGAPGNTVLARALIATAARFDKDGRSLDMDPSPLTAEALFGGLVTILQRRVADATSPPLSSMLDDLAEILISPYAGTAAARGARDVAPPPRYESGHGTSLTAVAAALAAAAWGSSDSDRGDPIEPTQG